MPIQFRERLVKLEGTLERLFGGRPPREPLEVRRAVVESLTGEIRPVGGGRRVLPVGRVTVAVVATDATEKRLFKEALTGPDGVEADLRRALDAAGAEWPRGFSLTVKFVKTAGDDWRSGARFHVTRGRSRRSGTRARARDRIDARRRQRLPRPRWCSASRSVRPSRAP